jgi:hypothetical protein
VRKVPAIFFLFLCGIIFAFPWGTPAEGSGSFPGTPPLLNIIAVRLTPEKPNTQEVFEVSFTIRNSGNRDAINVAVDFDGLGNFQVAEGFTNRKTGYRFTTDDSNWVHYKLKSVKGRKGNEIRLNFTYDYYEDYGDLNKIGTASQQLTVTLPLPEVDSDLFPPNIAVRDVSLETVSPGEEGAFNAVIYLDNFSNTAARQVTVGVDGQDNFEVAEVSNQKFLPAVSREGNNFIAFKLRAKEERAANSLKLNLTYFYGDESKEGQQSLLVNLPLEKASGGSKPQLKVQNFTLSQGTGTGEHRLHLILANLGQGTARDVSLTLDGGQNAYVTQSSNLSYLPDLKGKEEVSLEYTLGINAGEGNNFCPLNLALEYQDPWGNKFSSQETVGINIAELSGSGSGGKPKVMISKYSLSEEKILAGNVVTLSLFIENTHARPVQNIKVALGVIQVEGEGGASTGGTVFSPVNSSNSFFIEQVPARTVFEKNIDLYVDPNAAAKTYIVPITIEYEDQQANSYSASEMVNIPVTQECKLQILSLDVPPVAFAGQPAFIGAEFVNVGKVALNNFIVMLDGDFHKEQASYYVGNLQMGESDFYQGTILPEEEGKLSGRLIFSYIDNNNKEVQLEEEFELEVQAMGPSQDFPGEEHPDGPGHPGGFAGRMKKALLWLVPLLAAGLGIGIYLWRRKIKKKNEEFLDA